MTHRKYHFHNGKKGAALAVRILANSPVDEIVELLQDGTLKIRLASSPMKTDINQALAIFLAKVLKVPKSKIEIVAGHSRRNKLVSILDIDAELAHQKILDYLN